MTKISKVEDILPQEKDGGITISPGSMFDDSMKFAQELGQFLGNDDLMVIPADDYGNGCVGINIIEIDRKNPDDSRDNLFSYNVYGELNSTVLHESKKDFVEALQDNLDKDYLILPGHDPENGMLGFFVVKNSGMECHRMNWTELLGG